MSDCNEIAKQVRANPEFLRWVESWLGDWESEYSGEIYGLLRAFEAGRDVGRKEQAEQ